MKYCKQDAKDCARENLRGLWVTPLVPLRPDSSVDEEGFRLNLRHWIVDLGVDGICLCNKIGEYSALTPEEWQRLIAISVDECGGRIGIAVSCSDQNIEMVIALARQAEVAGVDWVVVHAPLLPLVTDRDQIVYSYYEYICSQFDIGVIFWSHPDAGYIISPEMCVRIGGIPSIVACKYSVARPMYAALSRMADGGLIVSNGSEVEWLDNITELGWQFHFASSQPYLMQTASDTRVKEYTSLAMRGQVEEARKVYDSLEPVRRALRSTRPGDKPHAHQKYWLELLGRAGGTVRRPMLDLTDAEKASVRSAFEDCGLQA